MVVQGQTRTGDAPEVRQVGDGEHEASDEAARCMARIEEEVDPHAVFFGRGTGTVFVRFWDEDPSAELFAILSDFGVKYPKVKHDEKHGETLFIFDI